MIRRAWKMHEKVSLQKKNRKRKKEVIPRVTEKKEREKKTKKYPLQLRSF